MKALLLGALLLSGCASIPLSTMARFSSYDASDFVSIDPNEVRANITVPAEFAIDHAATTLSVSINGAGTENATSIPLQLIREDTVQLAGGWFASAKPGRRQTLRLTPPGVEMFRALQRTVAAHKLSSINFNVSWKFSQTPPDTKEISLWVDLQLSQKQGFFPLVRNARIPFTNDED